MPRTRPLTRTEIAAELGVSRPTIERLVAAGRLQPMGRRGRAHTYSAAAVRRLARELAPGVEAAGDVVIADLAAQTADYHDRADALDESWIAGDVSGPAWSAAVAALTEATRHWPAVVGARVGDAPEAATCYAIDAPLITPIAPTDKWEPAERLARQLVTEAPIAEAVVTDRAAAAGCALWLVLDSMAHYGGRLVSGTWQAGPVDPDLRSALKAEIHHAEAVRRAPAPLMRALLSQLAVDVSAALGALDAALRAPAPPAPVPAPADVDTARAAWREARAAFRRRRVAVRRGHRRRAEVIAAASAGLAAFRRRWWSWPGELARHAGRPAEALAAASALHRDALADLARALEAA